MHCPPPPHTSCTITHLVHGPAQPLLQEHPGLCRAEGGHRVLQHAELVQVCGGHQVATCRQELGDLRWEHSGGRVRKGGEVVVWGVLLGFGGCDHGCGKSQQCCSSSRDGGADL